MANWFSARFLLGGFILLLATLLVVLVVGNLRQKKTEIILDVVRPDADLAMQKINYTEIRDGLRRWSVQADSAQHDLEKNSAVIENVRMVIYGQADGDVRLSARSGRFDVDRKLVTLSGDVMLENLGGYTVRTGELEFDGKIRILRGYGLVQIDSAMLSVAATGMRYDLNSRRLQLHADVKALFSGAMRLP